MDCKQIAAILSKLNAEGSQPGVPDSLLALLTVLKLTQCDKYTVMWGEKVRMVDQCLQIINDLRRNEIEPHPLAVELLNHFRCV
jgi:hypothetical protein